MKDVAQLLARMACNNHTICDEDLRPVGVGLYPLGALLNHSCTPNCMQSFGPRGRIEFRSVMMLRRHRLGGYRLRATQQVADAQQSRALSTLIVHCPHI